MGKLITGATVTGGAAGTVMIAAAQTKPEEAASNIAGWLRWLGADTIPSQLASTEADWWLTLVGGLILLSVTWVWLWSRRKLEAPAEDEPSVNPKFRLLFNRTDADEIVYILPWEKHKKSYLLEFELALHNTDTVDLEDAYLIMEIPSEIYGPQLPRTFTNSLRIVSADRFVDPVDGRELTRVTYKFGSIQPNVRVLVADFLCLRGSSRHRSSVIATCKDGVDVEVKYQFVFGFEVNLLVVAKNAPPFRRHVSVWSFDHSDPILKNLDDPNGALFKAIATGDEWDKAKTARLFFVEKPELNPKEFPPSVRKRIARVKLEGIPNQMVTSHPSLGFLPFGKPTKSRRREPPRSRGSKV